MHIEARLFEFLTAFFVLAAVVYAVLTAMFQYGGIEWAGTTALVLTAGLTLITGTFFRFVARRLMIGACVAAVALVGSVLNEVAA